MENWVSLARPGLSVPPVLPEPKVPVAIKERAAPKDQPDLLVHRDHRDHRETPAWRALQVRQDPEAKEGLPDLTGSPASREKPAIKEKPVPREPPGLPGPPGPWAHQGSQR